MEKTERLFSRGRDGREDCHDTTTTEPESFPAGFAKNAIIAVLLVALLVSWFRPVRNAARPTAEPQFHLADPVEKATSAFVAMECANRGFLLTGDPSFRDTFNSERDRFSDSYKVLKVGSEGVESRLETLKRVKDKFTRWFQLYNPMIEGRRTNYNYKPNRDTLQECRILQEEIFRDLKTLQTSAARR